MASRKERDRSLRSSQSRNLDSPFVEEELFLRENDSEWEAHLAALEAESPFRYAFEQGRSILVEPEELEEEFTEEDNWTEMNYFPVDEAEAQVDEEIVDWEDDIVDLDKEYPVYHDREDKLFFEDEELLEETSPAEASGSITDFVPLPVEYPGGGRIQNKRDPPPKDLETIKGYLGKRIQLHRLAAIAWKALVAAARREGIREPLLLPVSGYRSYSLQDRLFQGALDKYKSRSEARKWVAPPGSSPHQSGRAIDFYLGGSNSSGNVVSLRKKPAYLWLTKNARRFGFYPYEREPWHWEYNPSGSKERLKGEASVNMPTFSNEIVPIQFSQQGTARPAVELVRFAQRVLNATEGERLSDDGNLGQLTRAALERFRKKYGLGIGGVLDASIELALAQKALEKLAQASIFTQLGVRDTKTEQAITTFKASRQLGASSKIDAPTRLALMDALARMAHSPAISATMPQKPVSTTPSAYLGGKLWTFQANTLSTLVAVFCPPAALSKREVEVLVFAHGLLSGCKKPRSIPDGIITDAPFKLGDIVAASSRPIVLVVPYLDWANPGGEHAFDKNRRKWHALGKPAHLNSLVAEVLTELGRVQGSATPSLRNLIIAGHSRAYDFLEPLVHSRSDPQMQQGALARLSQVWAFDSTYTGDVRNWESWLNANPRLQISVFYIPGSKTGKIGNQFYNKRGGRLAVIRVKEGHCEVPARRLPGLLKSPASIADKETETHWNEDELDNYYANLRTENNAPEMYEDEAIYDGNATYEEFEIEFDSESDNAFNLEEEYEVDSFDSLDELDVYEHNLSSEPELEALAFNSMGSDDEYTFDYEHKELEDEDYAGQLLEEEAYGLEQETILEPEAPVAKEVIFPSGQSLRILIGYPEGKGEEFWDPTGSSNPLLDTGPAQKEKMLSTNFTVRELTTSGGISANIARIDPKLVENVQRLRNYLGKPVTILSGYRSWKLNKRIYDDRREEPTLSQHCGGRAVDIKIKGMNGLEIGKAAIDACGPNIGIGLGRNLVHIDVRGYAAVWKYGDAHDSWIKEIYDYQKAKGGKQQPSPKAAQQPNDLVRFAQRVLNASEGERLTDDGKMGRLTREALERFRIKYDLGTGGMLDSKTEIALAQKALETLAQQSMFSQPGLLDTRTKEALSYFKSERGLGFNATLDTATRAALADALQRRASTPSSPVPVVKPNSRPKLGMGVKPPTDPKAYRKFRLTTYHIVDQSELPTGTVRVPIYSDKGQKIAEGSPQFFAQLSLEGTARLMDGRLINVTGKSIPVSHEEYAEVLAYHRKAYAKRDKKLHEEGKKITPTTYSGIVVENNRIVRALAFHEVPASQRGVGYGILRGIPLVPFRTLAADIGHIKHKKADRDWKGKGGLVPPGTHVYIKEYNGLQLPDRTRHDGWFIVNDTGGGIFGAHFDVFVGTPGLRKQVKLPEFGHVWFAGIEKRIPPDYTYGLEL